MGLSDDLAVKLYQSISEDNKDRVFEHWHASSISMCPRAHYFKRLNIPELQTPSAAKILRWGAGHHLEASIRPHLEKLYPELVSNERLTSTRLDLTGEYDNFSPEAKTIVEVKSVDDFAFWDRDGITALKLQTGTWPSGQKKWSWSDEPYLGHQLQNHCYVLLLRETGVEVEQIHYVYLSLRGRVVAYKTEVSDLYLDEVKRILGVLNEAWKTKTPPPCICEPSHPMYDSVLQWCPYKTEDGCCDTKLIKEVK